jgi:hypothetical protein
MFFVSMRNEYVTNIKRIRTSIQSSFAGRSAILTRVIRRSTALTRTANLNDIEPSASGFLGKDVCASSSRSEISFTTNPNADEAMIKTTSQTREISTEEDPRKAPNNPTMMDKNPYSPNRRSLTSGLIEPLLND